MKHLRFLFFTIFLVFQSLGNAYQYDSCDPCLDCPDECKMSDCCSDCWGHIDWLYWKPRRCGLDYGWDQESGEVLGHGKSHHVCPGYSSGFRLGVFKGCDCWNFGVRYTRLCAEDSDKTSPSGNTNVVVTRGHPQFTRDEWDELIAPGGWAKSTFTNDFNLIELESSYTLCLECNNFLRFFGGVNLTYLDQDLHTKYDPDGQGIEVDGRIVKEYDNMDAYGLYLGLEGHWIVCNCFGIFGRASAGAAAACFERELKDLVYNTGTNTDTIKIKDKCWGSITYFDILAGIEYEMCNYCGADLSLQIGYEFKTWNNIMDFLNFIEHDAEDLSVGCNSRNLTNFGYDGVFISLNASY